MAITTPADAGLHAHAVSIFTRTFTSEMVGSHSYREEIVMDEPTACCTHTQLCLRAARLDA